MKMKSVCTLIIIIAFSCLPSISQAQRGPGPDPDATGIPFDGGLTLVIAAGAGYAIKKARDKRKKEKHVINVEK